jgi:hypothetical protein
MLRALIFDRKLREGLQRVTTTRATDHTVRVHGRYSSRYENLVLIRLREEDGSSKTWLEGAPVKEVGG